MAREFHIKTLSGTAPIGDLHVTVTTSFQDLLSDFTYSELLESEPLNALLSNPNIVAEDENGTTISGFGNMQPSPGQPNEQAICPFGAKSDSTGKFLIANGKSTDADDSSKDRTRWPIPISGTIIGVAYKTKEANSGTRMKLHIDGAVEVTFTLSSINGNKGGRENFAGPVVTHNNYAEIEYDAMQKPGECIMSLIIQP